MGRLVPSLILVVVCLPVGATVPAAPVPEAGGDAGQALAGLPNGLVLATPAHYSFACAVAADGAVWFTEFNRRQVRRYNPASGRAETVLHDWPGVYGIALSPEGTIFLGQDLGDHGNPGRVTRVQPAGGATEVVVSGLTRPRQLALDPHGDLYIVCEAGSQYTGPEPAVLRWRSRPGADAAVDVVCKGLRTPQGIAVAADGTLYISEYGLPGEEPGRVLRRAPNGVLTVVANGLWRARGLAFAPGGMLSVTTEANRGDQGNSGLLAGIDLATGFTAWRLSGLDYPQFPGSDAAGRVWFALNRDSWLARWDPACDFQPSAVPASMPAGAALALAGGALEPVRAAPEFRLEVAGHVVTGTPRLRPAASVLRGWLRLPAETVPLVRKELYRDRGDPEHPQPGLFAVPEVTVTAARGACQAVSLALRGHVGNRYPMTAVGSAGEAAAPGFSENPIAYLIYFEWRPDATAAAPDNARP